MSPDGNELQRALAFMAQVDESAATEVGPWRLGTGLITPELPRVWDASHFRVEDPAADDGERVATETLEAARAAGLAHDAVVITDEQVASRLRPGLLSAGFEEVRFLLMALRRTPDTRDDAVEEVSFADVAPSRRDLTLEMFPGDTALADQLADLDRRLERTAGGQWFAIKKGDVVASRAWLLDGDGVGQVEDVATSPAHRGRGLARAVVSAAARASDAAGNDLTFVIANDGETVTELYRKTGFDPIGFKWRFVKRLT